MTRQNTHNQNHTEHNLQITATYNTGKRELPFPTSQPSLPYSILTRRFANVDDTIRNADVYKCLRMLMFALHLIFVSH
ncbi:hypothetical protein T12_14346, partial [Trichinella patagoniensis]